MTVTDPDGEQHSHRHAVLQLGFLVAAALAADRGWTGAATVIADVWSLVAVCLRQSCAREQCVLGSDLVADYLEPLDAVCSFDESDPAVDTCWMAICLRVWTSAIGLERFGAASAQPQVCAIGYRLVAAAAVAAVGQVVVEAWVGVGRRQRTPPLAHAVL